MSLDEVLIPPGLSEGSYTLVSTVEFNETSKHYRYKNYEHSITVDSTNVTTPIKNEEKWRPYLVVYKHTKKTPHKVPSVVANSPLKEDDNEEPPRKIMRTLEKKNNDVVSDKKSDPVEKKVDTEKVVSETTEVIVESTAQIPQEPAQKPEENDVPQEKREEERKPERDTPPSRGRDFSKRSTTRSRSRTPKHSTKKRRNTISPHIPRKI